MSDHNLYAEDRFDPTDPGPEGEEMSSATQPEAATPLVKTAGCVCKPWEQSWHPDTPSECSTCGRPFVPYSCAREVCLERAGCLLLPGHEGACHHANDGEDGEKR